MPPELERDGEQPVVVGSRASSAIDSLGGLRCAGGGMFRRVGTFFWVVEKDGGNGRRASILGALKL